MRINIHEDYSLLNIPREKHGQLRTCKPMIPNFFKVFTLMFSHVHTNQANLSAHKQMSIAACGMFISKPQFKCPNLPTAHFKTRVLSGSTATARQSFQLSLKYQLVGAETAT